MERRASIMRYLSAHTNVFRVQTVLRSAGCLGVIEVTALRLPISLWGSFAVQYVPDLV